MNGWPLSCFLSVLSIFPFLAPSLHFLFSQFCLLPLSPYSEPGLMPRAGHLRRVTVSLPTKVLLLGEREEALCTSDVSGRNLAPLTVQVSFGTPVKHPRGQHPCLSESVQRLSNLVKIPFSPHSSFKAEKRFQVRLGPHRERHKSQSTFDQHHPS